MSLQHRLSESLETKSDSELLYDRYVEIKSRENQAKNDMAALRVEVDDKLSRGEFVGYSGEVWLTHQESVRYEVDQEKAKQVLGARNWARVSEVSGTKLKEALKIGLVSQAEFDAITTPKVTTSLVSKTQPKTS